MTFTVAYARSHFDCGRIGDRYVAAACDRATSHDDLRLQIMVEVVEWCERMES